MMKLQIEPDGIQRLKYTRQDVSTSTSQRLNTPRVSHASTVRVYKAVQGRPKPQKHS